MIIVASQMVLDLFVCFDVNRYVTCPEREYLINPSQTTQFDVCYAFGGSVVTMSVASGGVMRVTPESGAGLLQVTVCTFCVEVSGIGIGIGLGHLSLVRLNFLMMPSCSS